MPSTVVHVALAGLVGTALLAEYFDKKAILAVMAAVAFLDLDVFVGLVVSGTHRAAFHTLLLPGLAGLVLLYDLRARKWSVLRERSWVGPRSRIRSRWGARGVRVSWVSVVAVTLAGIGPDLFFNGVNLFYPIHDRFYTFSGEILYSNQRGFVQTLVEVNLGDLLERVSEAGSQPGAESGGGANGGGDPAPTTENTHYRTGVDPARGEAPEDVERLFPIAMTGERALLALTGYCVVGLRLWMERGDE
ncbi:metal-dependent hydrolase [Halobacteriales archaeon SW_6_65_15]|nr:MAG: metal-dependent hydrolase [Halobacteriales archaeon SW_6_65_15]